MKTKVLLLATLFVILYSSLGFTQGTITTRETIDPMNTGEPTWIKLTFRNSGGGSDNLNDDFTGTAFKVDLNIDLDNDEFTQPGNVYSVSGSQIKTHYTTGGNNDEFLYINIQGSHPTSIRPRIKLINSGSLRIGTSPFTFSILPDTDFGICIDTIKPIMVEAFYYDDGSGHTTAYDGLPGNTIPFDGFVDRIDLIWSEPMDSTIVQIIADMFTGLGATIEDVEATGKWYGMGSPPYYHARRFTFWVISNQPNTGMSIELTYNPPADISKAFKSDTPYNGSDETYAAEMQTIPVQDRAGPAIIAANTTRIHDRRRQPLPSALASKRILVKFSEPVDRSTLALGDTTFQIFMEGYPGIRQNVVAIHYPNGNSPFYELEIDSTFVTENDTGTIQFSNWKVLADLVGNYNGESLADQPPVRPTEPSVIVGLLIPITDGIFPNIVRVLTRDVALPSDKDAGGNNGWGYLDYLDVIFDHRMDITQLSTLGFTVMGRGLNGIGSTGWWINDSTFRFQLTAASPIVPNTDVVPQVMYTNPGAPDGLRDAENHGYAENIVYSDTSLSSNNYRVVEILDKAGPAIIRVYTAGQKKMRITFSEKIMLDHPSTSAWPTTPGSAYTPANKFRWFMTRPGGFINSWDSGIRIFFTGIDPSRKDNVLYLHHTGTSAQWTKEDSGGFNFINHNVVMDLVSNGNDQYDDENSLLSHNIMGSDIPIRVDNIPPNLLYAATKDFNRNGKIDHLCLVFDDTSAVYPKTFFNVNNWSVVSYYLQTDRPILGIDESRFTVVGGDTLGVCLRLEEANDDTLKKRPYYGDTGDIPDIVVGEDGGFSDWAGNYMAPLPIGLTKEIDGAGPAITGAKTISTTQVEALVSEDLKDGTVSKMDFFLEMIGLPVPRVALFNALEKDPDLSRSRQGRVILKILDQLYWLPTTEGRVRFVGPGVVYDNVSQQPTVQPEDNPNAQTHFIPVRDNIAHHFDIELKIPGNPVRGVPFQIQITALDENGNRDMNFPERINISSNLTNDKISIPTGSQSLIDGIGLFNITSWIATENLVISVSIENDRLAQYFSSSDPITVVEPVIDAPDTLIVQDYRGPDGYGDQGGFVVLTFDFSQNHPGIGTNNIIDFYQVYREIDHKVYQSHTIPAVDTTGSRMDSMRVILQTKDNFESNFWVQAIWDPDNTSQQTNPSSPDIEVPSGYIMAQNMEPILVTPTKEKQAESTSVKSAEITQQNQVVSGAIMGRGRAIDNIPPHAPLNLIAQKEGVAIKLLWNAVSKGIDGSDELFGIKYNIYAHSENAFFNPEHEGQLVASVQDTMLLLTVSDLCSYYCVRAVDSDNMSEASEKIGKYGFKLYGAKSAKYNYLSLPLDVNNMKQAKDLANSVTGLEAIYQLNPATNLYSTFYLPKIKFGTNFPIKTGQPVLVSADDQIPESWFYTGKIPAPNSIKFQLSKGETARYNEIIIPLDKANLKTADELAKDIGGVEALYKLDPGTNLFSKFWVPSIQYGENFEIKAGEPILINVNQNAPDVWPQ